MVRSPSALSCSGAEQTAPVPMDMKAEEEERRKREHAAHVTQLFDRLVLAIAAAGLVIMTAVAQRGEADGAWAWAAGLAGMATVFASARWFGRIAFFDRLSELPTEGRLVSLLHVLQTLACCSVGFAFVLLGFAMDELIGAVLGATILCVLLLVNVGLGVRVREAKAREEDPPMET